MDANSIYIAVDSIYAENNLPVSSKVTTRYSAVPGYNPPDLSSITTIKTEQELAEVELPYLSSVSETEGQSADFINRDPDTFKVKLEPYAFMSHPQDLAGECEIGTSPAADTSSSSHSGYLTQSAMHTCGKSRKVTSVGSNFSSSMCIKEESKLHVTPVLLYKNVHASDGSSSTALENGHKPKRTSVVYKKKRLRPRSKGQQAKCSECGLVCKTVWCLKIHMSVKRYGEKAQQREEKEKLKSKIEQKVDKYRADPGRSVSFKCPECSKPFSTEASLESHLTTHLGQEPYWCSHCFMRSRTAAEKKEHDKTHQIDQTPFECPLCSLAFRTEKELIAHTKTHSLTYKCDDCSEVFKTKNSKISHASVHLGQSKRYWCQKCRMEFDSAGRLERHSTVHTKERQIACSECDSAFKTKIHLKQHQRVHRGPKPFKCKECSEEFKFSKDLKAHARTHPGPDPFKCPQCPAVFKYLSDLKKHYQTHPQETLHHCPMCPAAFQHPHQLEAHSIIHTTKNAYKFLGYSTACSNINSPN